jgi:asparagine synthase (glutamine-hydrolysing)
LYWHHSAHGLIWGSEAKALLVAPWVERQIEPLALHHYLTLQYVPDPLTIYKGTYRLPAAHKLVVERDGQIRVQRWWQLAFEPKWQLSEAETIEQAQALLSAAVKRQLVSEVPLGAFLSGGLDSSLIVSLMAEHLDRPVKTFSIGFAEQHYSETHFARQVAERYGTDHHEFLFSPSHLTNTVEGVIAATDEPFADPAALPLYELARQTRQHVTVALSGDGGDETLAGYQRYMLDGLLRPYAALPAWVSQRAVPALASVLPDVGWIPEDRNPITGIKRLGQFSAVTPKASLVRWGSYFTHEQKLSLYADHVYESLCDVQTTDVLALAYDSAQAEHRLDRTLAADQATYLAGDLLPKTDRMTMAHSLESRSPFLDADWVEWMARLPVRYKVRGAQTKWLLKAAFADRLPPAVAARGKQGFSVPVGLWLRSELRDWARDRLLANPALDEWFRPVVVTRLLDQHDSGRVNHGKRLWAVLMFALWLECGAKGTYYASV